jgi:hypothetical protein
MSAQGVCQLPLHVFLEAGNPIELGNRSYNTQPKEKGATSKQIIQRREEHKSLVCRK